MTMCKNKYAKLWDYGTRPVTTHTVKLRNGRLTISDGLDWTRDVMANPTAYSLSAYDKAHDFDAFQKELRSAKQKANRAAERLFANK